MFPCTDKPSAPIRFHTREKNTRSLLFTRSAAARRQINSYGRLGSASLTPIGKRKIAYPCNPALDQRRSFRFPIRDKALTSSIPLSFYFDS